MTIALTFENFLTIVLTFEKFQSVGQSKQAINAVGVHGKAGAASTAGRGGGGGYQRGGLTQAQMDAQKRKRALDAARNPGGRGGQVHKNELVQSRMCEPCHTHETHVHTHMRFTHECIVM